MRAWASVGSVCPTFSVPGIFSSGTIRHRRNADVVGANEPIPSVSKKLVTNPSRFSRQAGTPDGSPERRAVRNQKSR